MKLVLSYCQSFNKGLKLVLVALALSPVLVNAQANRVPVHKPILRAHSYVPSVNINDGNLRTTGTPTCPVTGGFTLQGQDTAGNTVNNHATLCQNANPFFIQPGQPNLGGIPSPCVSTTFTNFDNSLANFGTEIGLQGGVPQFTLCPTCTEQIGYGSGVSGQPWVLQLFNLDSSQKTQFVLCNSGGAIVTSTVTLNDCWTGNQFPTTATSTTSTTFSTSTSCDTLTLAANTNIGDGVYTITPATGSVAVTYFGGGGIEVQPSSLSPGNYVVNYTFTPPSGDGCTAVTANFHFKIIASPTVTVSGSQTICPGGSTTLTASSTSGAGTNFTWTPSGTLSASTGSVVVASPTVTTLYTVATQTTVGATCAGEDTIRITVIPSTFTVNPVTMCAGTPTKLIASNSALTYTWAPAAGATISANTDTALVNPTSTTVYTITGSNGTCTPMTITDSVKVIATPTISVLSPTVCAGTTATITATGSSNYTWTPTTGLTIGVTGDTVYANTPTVSTSYTVTGTGANGCPAMAVSNVVVNNYLGVITNSATICYGSNLYMSAVGASTYTWTTSDPTNLSFAPNDTTYHVNATIANVGTYSVYVYGESHTGVTCKGYDTVTVVVNPTPTITAVSPTSTAICSGTTTTLTASAAPSGTLAVTWGWAPAPASFTTTTSSDSSTATVTPTVTTNYLATAIYSFSTGKTCSSNTTITVYVNPTPAFTINSPSICLGQSATLSLTPTPPNTTYIWTGLSATTASVIVTPTTTTPYTVTATDTAHGLSCASSPVFATVTVIPLPTVTVTPSFSMCAGNTATLTAGGTAATYTWNSSSTTYTTSSNTTNPNILLDSPSTTTIYSVTGTSAAGGCTTIKTTTVTVNPTPTFSINTTNPAICVGGSSTLTAVSTTTATTATYTWTPATGLSVPTVTTSVVASPVVTTNYTVNALAADGCPYQQITTVTVNTVAPIVAPTATTICNGSSTLLATTPGLATYIWTPTVSLGTPNNQFAVDATPNSTTNYTVFGQDAFGCPSNTVTVTVTVSTPTASASATNTIVCQGQAIDLTSNTWTGATYSWTASNGDTYSTQDPIISVSSPSNTATYSLTITIGGCTSPVSTVTVNVIPTPSITVIGNYTVCPNNPVTYTCATLNGATSYSWSPSSGVTPVSATVFSVSAASTTSYSVTGYSNGCPSKAVSVTLNVDPITASFVPTPDAGNAPLKVTFTNNSIPGTSGATNYTWNYGIDNSTYTTTSINDPATDTTYSFAGTYTVTLITSDKICSYTITATIVVTDAYSMVIPNVFTPNGDDINESFFVKAEGVSSINILIFDRWGLKMFESNSLTAGAWDGKNMGGKEVPSDTYFYIINATDNKGNNNKYKGDIRLIR